MIPGAIFSIFFTLSFLSGKGRNLLILMAHPEGLKPPTPAFEARQSRSA